MKALEFERLLKALAELSRLQRKQVLEKLSRVERGEGVADYLQGGFEAAPKCPHCAHTRLYRHGQANGLQRYRCRACRRTFNVLTGTPLARLRHKSKWLGYLQSLLASQTIRQAAQGLGVNPKTSFRWRHRFLEWIKNDRPNRLHGITEADETYFHESLKGARKLHRPARRRGSAAKQRGTSKEHVCVVIARDRTGQTADFVSGRGPVSKAQLHQHLQPLLDEDVLLVSDDNASYRYFAHEAGISHETVTSSAGERVRGAFHVQNVNAYHSRLRTWIQRFHGVATRYLPNYLGWQRALDSRRLSTPKALLHAAVRLAPQLTAGPRNIAKKYPPKRAKCRGFSRKAAGEFRGALAWAMAMPAVAPTGVATHLY